MCRQVLGTTEISINGQSQAIEYVTLARSGQQFGAHKFGRLTDKLGNVIYMNGSKTVEDISNNPDFSSIMVQPNGKIYSVTHFESPRPGNAYFSELVQNKTTGKLTIKSSQVRRPRSQFTPSLCVLLARVRVMCASCIRACARL